VTDHYNAFGDAPPPTGTVADPTKVADPKAAMAVYDALPVELRNALAEYPMDMSPWQLRDALDNGMTVPDLLAAIQEARRETGLSFLPE
jgi:hypothetical protein